MKLKALLLGVFFCLMAATGSLADDGFIGTWKLNEAKSKFAPGPTRNSTVVYEASGDSVKITIDGIGADGKPSHNEWTGKFDGKDYPVTGNPAEDTRALKKVNDHTLQLTLKKDGKVTMTGSIVLSSDGKTRTVTTSGKDEKGNKVTNTTVYEKQ